MKNDIHTFVSKCDMCQKNKDEIVNTPRKLKPLLFPTIFWDDISMDFIIWVS
jgi:hypothetical protein